MPELPDLQQVASSGPAGVQVSISSATAPGLGLAAAGRSIGKIGDELYKESMDQQKAYAQGIISDARLGMQTVIEEHKMFRQENPDENLWADDYRGRVGALKDRFKDAKLLPDYQDRYNRLFAQWDEVGSLQVQNEAKAQSKQRATKLSDEVIRSYAASGRVDDAARAYDEGVEAGIYHPDPALREQNIKAWSHEKDIADLTFGIEADPLMAAEILAAKGDNGEFLNYPDMTTNERNKFLKQAQAELGRQKSDAVKNIYDKVEELNIQSEEQLVKMLDDDTMIDEKSRKKILRNWNDTRPITLEVKQGITDRLNSLHDQYRSGEIDRAEYSKGHYSIAQEVYEMGRRDGTGGLRTRVHQLDPSKWKENNLEAKDDENAEREAQQMGKAWGDAGGFGKPLKDEDKLTPDQALQVRDNREITEAQMSSWLQSDEGKKASPTERRAKFRQFAAEVMGNADIEETYRDRSGELEALLPSLHPNDPQQVAPGTMLPANPYGVPN